jgi:hypothetical protein
MKSENKKKDQEKENLDKVRVQVKVNYEFWHSL